MAKDAPGMKGQRSRNSRGPLRATRGDKYMGTLEKQYTRDFGVRSDMHVSTFLQQNGIKSVNDLIQSKLGK